MKVPLDFWPRLHSCFLLCRFVVKQFTRRPGGVVCTMTLRLFKFRVSAERSSPTTHANCMCDLRESYRINITPIIIAHREQLRTSRTAAPLKVLVSSSGQRGWGCAGRR
jgi:hypothetical protein